MRRETDVSTVCVALSVRERDTFEQMKRATGISSDANLIRVALYRLAAHLDDHVDTALFAIRRRRDRERRAS